jgi:hypothetical protein
MATLLCVQEPTFGHTIFFEDTDEGLSKARDWVRAHAQTYKAYKGGEFAEDRFYELAIVRVKAGDNLHTDVADVVEAYESDSSEDEEDDDE